MVYATDRSKAVPPLSPFLFVCGVYLFYISSSLYCYVSCFSGVFILVVFVRQHCIRLCSCSVDVFVVVRVVLNAVFPDHSHVFYSFE